MPMTLLIASDSHGRADLLERAVALVDPALLLFLGDGLRDLTALSERVLTRAVCGNCDWTARADAPPIRVEEIAGYRIYMTHGHLCSGMMGLVYTALENGADAALFGHTHQPYCEEVQGVLLLNPGSAGNTCRGGPARASVLTIDGGKMRVFDVEMFD
jgi:putative phosphoesterase